MQVELANLETLLNSGIGFLKRPGTLARVPALSLFVAEGGILTAPPATKIPRRELTPPNCASLIFRPQTVLLPLS